MQKLFKLLTTYNNYQELLFQESTYTTKKQKQKNWH